ncbi:DUF5013 domain-containing protein [Zunongwangia pacifica]|uniref:DUF5013 domain-containing protein n=1 Tax=Zunongwangia pacifica TaxID=2911062 RepID=A0A9X1ZNT9_9FLAO|nr:DUF5013 domain-containing protein [Zunongwangia pacifica]MCL6218202.1 DUF5013 domain-containing protein [Zunongwangia pacifica]
MNKKIKIYLYLILGFAFLWSCSDVADIDDYKEFVKGGEINYTEKVDSLKAFSGRNRIKIQGIVDADPKIKSFRVYWNSMKDSVVVPVTRTTGVDTLEVIINDISENIYNFEVRTFDGLGNTSIPQYTTGEVYGERYQSSLYNRPVIGNELIGSNLTVNYANMDRTTGVLGTEMEYTSVNSSELQEIFVPIDSTQAQIEDYTSGSEYRYRTVFLPEPTSIDTFYTEYKSFIPEAKLTDPPYFVNATYPFEKLESGDRWGTPAGWIHNEAALSHSGYGALDGDIFDLESGWNEPDLLNAKVYQTFVLPAGTYVYSIDIKELNYEGADNNLDKGYFTVAEGATLPDVDDVETSTATLASERINKSNGLQRDLIFTLDETTQVSIGVQTTNNQGAGRYLKINSFSLDKFTQAPYLKNASKPYQLASSGSRWGTPEYWIHNDAAMSHNDNGSQGAYDGKSKTWDLESGWEQPNIVNGKVYQTVFLDAGTYDYQIELFATNYSGTRSDTDQAYFIVAKGSTLPDVADVETSDQSIVYDRVDSDKGNSISMTFTLTEPTRVSIGAETTNKDGVGLYLQVNSFKLIKQ